MAVMSQQNRSRYNKLTHLAIKKNQLIIKKLSKWKIFPFTINNGTIPLTETGYKPSNSKITDFGQYELILTGNTPVIIIWKNSTKIYQKNKGIKDENGNITGQDQFYTKQYKVGDYWNAYLVDDNSGVSFGELSSNTIFKTISTTRQYTLIMFEEQIKTDDYLQFFCVFNDDNENIGGNTGDNQDRQLLYISNVTNYYDPYPGGKFAMQSITFSSINDRLQQSGQTTQGFIQYGGPGSGYAFPTIINGNVTVNKTLMRNIGVRYTHRQFYGIEAISSISYFGRPIIQGERPIQVENKEIYEQKVFSSRRLFIAGNNNFSTTDVKSNGGLYAGLNDPITTNSHPETTYYNIMDAKPTGYTNYNDWQEFLAAKQFNLLAEKSFKGILSFTKDLATKSNGEDISKARFFWDSQWFINNLKGIYNVEMSSNFRYKNKENNAIIGSSAVDYSKITQKSMSAILNFNSLIFSSLIQMPYSSEQWLPFAVSQIPLIGKMLNSLLLGIPIGWVITQNSQQYKKLDSFNAFMSAFYTSSLDVIFEKNGGKIPLNLFSNKNEFEIGTMLGAKVSTTAFLMKLTDRVRVYPWDPNTGNKLEVAEQISTIDLSQKKDNKVYICDETTTFLDIESPLDNLDKDLQWNPTENGIYNQGNYAYIIDYFVVQSLGQGEERHTFFSDNPFTYKGDYNETSVAQVKIKNQSSLTDNLFNWTTQYKMNMDEYDETEDVTFNYPSEILGADPMNIAKEIEIIPKTLNTNTNIKPQVLIWSATPVSDNSEAWFNDNKPIIMSEEIDFKDYLDPTFLINNINDLKRFYTTMQLSINYKYTTTQESKSVTISSLPGLDPFTVSFTTSENFSNKEEKNIINVPLDSLDFKNYVPPVKIKNFKTYNAGNISYKSRAASNYAGYDSKCDMIFNNIQFNVKQVDNHGGMWRINENLIIEAPIGLNIEDNGDMKWLFNIDICFAQIEAIIKQESDRDNGYGRRNISNITFSVDKITLVPR